MFSINRLSPAVLMMAGLTACGGGVRNVDTAKVTGYTGHPRTILAMQQDGDPFPDIFKTILAKKMADCRVRLKFAQRLDGAPVMSWPEAEAHLMFHQLDKETRTLTKTKTGQVLDKFVESYRYEFALYDVASKHYVWHGHGDFRTHDDLQDVHMVSAERERAAEGWSDELIDLMRKDNLLDACAGNPPPAPIVAIAPPPPPAQPAAQPAAPAQAAQAQIVPPRFKVEGVTYFSVADAEDALRKHAAAEVAKVKPLGVTSRPSLLIVVPTEAKFAKQVKFGPEKTEEEKQTRLGFSAANRQVTLDSDAEALRKSGLFQQVSVLREDALAEDDFRGAAYKIWQASGSSWQLARKSGGKQPVKGVASTVKYPELAAMLTDLQTALAALDKS